VPQNANAPTLVGKPLYDAPQAPMRELPVEPATRPRSWLVPFTRYLMIFAAGIVATLVWQSWSGTAKEALRVAARKAICPQATPVAQGTPDKTSTPLSLLAKPLATLGALMKKRGAFSEANLDRFAGHSRPKAPPVEAGKSRWVF
jgi:hypothetical protein